MARAQRKSQRRKSQRRKVTSAEVFERLADFAMNLHWTWNPDAHRLFAALEPPLWKATNHNPIKMLEHLSPDRRDRLADDERLLAQLQVCEKQLRGYLRARTWFQKTSKGRGKRLRVGYFCSEYAIHESMPQYAGGLGVLAGDHLKAASDLGIPIVGVGLLYRRGYYRQELNVDGTTRVVYPQFEFREFPIEDTGQTIGVPVARRKIYVKIWKMQVGRTELYLLDADISRNAAEDRVLTHELYGGDSERRLEQQVLLGVGGFRALEAVGRVPTVCHLNEGHAAFCGVERVRRFVADGFSYEAAIERVRRTTVFTTHTPVAAGHDSYDWKMVLKYLLHVIEGIGVSWDDFLALGRAKPEDPKSQFCMTVLALKLSAHCNGVSKLHGEVSREMWRDLYPDVTLKKVPIGHVTNGIHTQTWLAPQMAPAFSKHLRVKWDTATPDSDWGKLAAKISAREFWRLRNVLRARLVQFVRERLIEQIQRRVGPIEEYQAAYQTLDPDALTIGFARRFATYKRAPLIFKNAQRLAKILNDPKRPVQLIFAGKAHPRDTSGREFVQQIYRQTRAAKFEGRVVLLEEYDMQIGRMLTSGCDVWLNNPLRPLEASGTSGMKPPLHGGINCSILDGWWPEAFNKRNGWAIGDGRTLKSQAAQDKYDVEQIYTLLEKQIVPLFYQRGRDGVPKGWVRMMTQSLKTAAGPFSAHRMLGEYLKDYYLPAHR